MKLVHRIARRLGFQPITKRNGGYAAAFAGRLTSDWITMSGGPTQELFASIRLLRDRARDLEKNNPLVRRYLHLVAENVVGPKGFTLQARTDSARNNTAIESAYAEWGRPVNHSVDGRTGRVAFQQAVIRGVARDGEAFVREVRTGPHGFALQLIDPALVDESFNRAAGDGKAAVKLGIEVDAWDRPLAYHVLTGHRYDATAAASVERLRIPADEIHHLFVQRRPGQVRGESWLAPVMIALRMLDGYTEAELVAARTAAAKMGFIITKDEGGTVTDPDAPRREMEAAPGVIDELDPGQEFQEWNPSHPSQNFALFVTQVAKFIAAGLNVSFAGLTSDLREVNFSSSRIGALQERDAWRVLQWWMIESLVDPVYRHWREVAWASGRLPLRMVPSQYDTHQWMPRGWAYTNPREEQVADLVSIAGGLKDPTQIIAEHGDDAESVITGIAAWHKLADAAGVTLHIPNSVVNPDGQADDRTVDANAGDRPGGDADAGRGGRAHPDLALVRAAGQAVVR